MSKQSSLHPDESEVTGVKSKHKKKKHPWVLSSRYHMRRGKPPRWTKWSVDGRYKTEEDALKVRDKKLRDYGGILANFYEFRVDFVKD
jgi:hypothetical protein